MRLSRIRRDHPHAHDLARSRRLVPQMAAVVPISLRTRLSRTFAGEEYIRRAFPGAVGVLVFHPRETVPTGREIHRARRLQAGSEVPGARNAQGQPDERFRPLIRREEIVLCQIIAPPLDSFEAAFFIRAKENPPTIGTSCGSGRKGRLSYGFGEVADASAEGGA